MPTLGALHQRKQRVLAHILGIAARMYKDTFTNSLTCTHSGRGVYLALFFCCLSCITCSSEHLYIACGRVYSEVSRKASESQSYANTIILKMVRKYNTSRQWSETLRMNSSTLNIYCSSCPRCQSHAVALMLSVVTSQPSSFATDSFEMPWSWTGCRNSDSEPDFLLPTWQLVLTTWNVTTWSKEKKSI